MLKIKSLFVLLVINTWLRVMSFRLHGVRVGRGSWIKSFCQIGRGTGIGWGFCVRGAGELSIGKFCAIGENLRVITNNHEVSCLSMNLLLQDELLDARLLSEKKDVVIGNDVWIGDNVIILPGVTVGDGCVIGAGALVTKSIPGFSIVAGNPAKVLRKRFSEENERKISELRWWDWDMDKIKRNRHLFSSVLTEGSVFSDEVK